MMRPLLAALGVITLMLAPVSAQEPTLDVVLSRAAAYVVEFQRQLSGVVAEERYVQDVRYPLGSGTRYSPLLARHRELKSDLLMVKPVGGDRYMQFRDVFEVDGKAVRDRNERLMQLFVSPSASSASQSDRIMQESSRYNIGNIERTINQPTLPLLFVTPALRDHFRFELVKRDPEEGTIVEFHEVKTPTYVSDRQGSDMPSTGKYWIDETTGAIRRTELDVVHTAVQAHIRVAYRLDEGLTLWVPARMEERYRDRRGQSEVRGTATYSRFRKFQVSTSEEVAQ